MNAAQIASGERLGAMLSEIVGGLALATNRAGETDDTPLEGLLGGLHRIAGLAVDEWEIAAGVATR